MKSDAAPEGKARWLLSEDPEGLGREAADFLRGFFSRKATDDDLVKGRIAAGLLSTLSRVRQTDRAWAGKAMSLGRVLAKDDAEFSAYLRLTARQLPALRELPLPGPPSDA